jgi:Domain of unknown function (DUF4382)
MSQMTRFTSTAGLALALFAALSGCNSRTNVSATGTTPTQFTHVFITAQAVWFNTKDNASPDDAGWAKFALKTPVTIDLVQQSNGTLGELVNDLRVAPGTYNSILLLPYSATEATATASAAVTTNLAAVGATYPQEADFMDAAGNNYQVALVLPNPEKGIVVPGASLKVPVGSVGAGAGGLGGTSTTGTSTTGTTTATTGTTTTNGTTTSSTASTTKTVSFGTFFDANRDLHLFCPAGAQATCTVQTNSTPTGTTTGVLLSTNPVATDLSTTGGISGTLTLTSLTNSSTTNLTSTNLTAISGRVAIQASAELLSADGSHHVIIASAPLQTDGTFTIYPLQSNSKTPTVYDVVIHGPNIATIIIKNVSVTTTTPSLTGAASTTGAVATTTASGAVSLGTFIPRAANAFSAQIIPSTTSPLPGGAAVTFYQTLPASGEVPYAIDEVGIDPIAGNLQTPEVLSQGSIYSGTYASSGSTITVTSSTPADGASTYHVSATAPLYTDGAISSAPTVNGTTAQSLTTPLTVTVSGLTPADGAAPTTLSASITESAPGTYTGGELLVSHNGAVIGSAPIASSILLSGSGTVTVPGLPSASGSYYLSAILWSGSAFKYESVASPVTVSAGTTQVAVPLN